MSSPFNCPRRALDNRQTDFWFKAEGEYLCSYCGSLRPDQVLARIAAGETITPTDKNYKAYLANYRKIYFQHFSEDDCKEFIRLYNLGPGEGQMKVGPPGHFYRLPYFMGYKAANE